MAIGCSKDALVFYFCSASTKKWKIFQTILSSFRQCLHFIDGDEKILELIKLVDEQVDDLVACI